MDEVEWGHGLDQQSMGISRTGSTVVAGVRLWHQVLGDSPSGRWAGFSSAPRWSFLCTGAGKRRTLEGQMGPIGSWRNARSRPESDSHPSGSQLAHIPLVRRNGTRSLSFLGEEIDLECFNRRPTVGFCKGICQACRMGGSTCSRRGRQIGVQRSGETNRGRGAYGAHPRNTRLALQLSGGLRNLHTA